MSDESRDTSFGSQGTESGFQSGGKCLSVSHETDSAHPNYVIMSGTSASSGLVVHLTPTGALDSQHFGNTGKVSLFTSGYSSSSANYLEEAMFAQGGGEVRSRCGS